MGLRDVLGRATVQVFVRDDCAMIAAPVQCDVDGIPKWAHRARVSPMRPHRGAMYFATDVRRPVMKYFICCWYMATSASP